MKDSEGGELGDVRSIRQSRNDTGGMMPKLADMRIRLHAIMVKSWKTHRKDGTGTEIRGPHGIVFGQMKWPSDAAFAAHAPDDMRALLDGLDGVLDGKPIRYVVTRLDLIAQGLEAEGDHGMAQMLSRLAVMLERLG